MTWRLLAVVSAALLNTSGVTAGGETWLAPERTVIVAGGRIELRLGSGECFPRFEAPVPAERVEVARGWLDGHDRRLWTGQVKEGALHLFADANDAGVAVFGVELHPDSLQRSDAEADEYLEEIAAPPAVRARWGERPAGTQWQEVARQSAKTCVRVEPIGRDESWTWPLGLPLELVPQGDPFDLPFDGAMWFRLLHNGVAVTGCPVRMLTAGGRERLCRTTDEDGQVAFPVRREGQLLLYAVVLEQEGDVAHWRSESTTLALAVGRGGKDPVPLAGLSPGTLLRLRRTPDGAWSRSTFVGTTERELLLTRTVDTPVDSVPLAGLVRLEASMPEPVRAARPVVGGLTGMVVGGVAGAMLAGSRCHGSEWCGFAAVGGMSFGALGGLVVGIAVGLVPTHEWRPVELPRGELTPVEVGISYPACGGGTGAAPQR